MIKLTKKEQIELAHLKSFCAYLYKIGQKNKDVYNLFNEEMKKKDPVLCLKQIKSI